MSDSEPINNTDDKIILEVLRWSMSFGHKPSAKETLEILRENGYDIIKKSLSK